MFLTLIFWCWTVFIVIWLIGMVSNKRTIQRGSLARRWVYMAFAFMAFWLLFGRVFRHSQVFLPSPVLGFVALGLTVLGLLLAIWARVTLGRNWSGSVTFKENHELVVRGPYAFVRHPIYTAMLLMFLGTALGLGKLGGFVGVPILFLSFWIKYRQEEAFMIEHFGDQYRDYMKRVKAIIPMVF